MINEGYAHQMVSGTLGSCGRSCGFHWGIVPASIHACLLIALVRAGGRLYPY